MRIHADPDPQPWLKFDTFTAGENSVSSSVVDPNTLNLDPDPEFRPNLDPDPGLCYQF